MILIGTSIQFTR